MCVPIALLREVGLESGDDVYFELSADRRSIVILPAAELPPASAPPR